jgi:transcriptional regulator with PAS, ATPase and Fis domain
MSNPDVGPFIRGLKRVINSKYSSQVEFAEGVTSKVNLSNILRGNSGTSESMRQKLAERAGMTIEEIISIGKRSAVSGFNHGQRASDMGAFGNVAEMNATEIINKANDINLGITEHLLNHTRMTNNVISTLTTERDKLLTILQSEQAILNAITDKVKVVDRKLNITYCNRAATEANQQVIGDSCKEPDCDLCNSGCIALSVFTSGKTKKVLQKTPSGSYESRVAYPQLSSAV